jgi:hypothetical protein
MVNALNPMDVSVTMDGEVLCVINKRIALDSTPMTLGLVQAMECVSQITNVSVIDTTLEINVNSESFQMH